MEKLHMKKSFKNNLKILAILIAGAIVVSTMQFMQQEASAKQPSTPNKSATSPSLLDM